MFRVSFEISKLDFEWIQRECEFQVLDNVNLEYSIQLSSVP